MKPSELASSTGQAAVPVVKLKFAVDEKAEPPITVEEALAANGALCPWHPGSLMGQRGDKEGMVYLCLHRSCRMYRRYEKHRGPSKQKLPYPALGYA
jgi:hypothetical protein